MCAQQAPMSRPRPMKPAQRLIPAPPPHFTSAANCSSVRLRGNSLESAAAFEWLAMTGFSAISKTSQNVRSEACERSTATPTSCAARTNALPASVRPRPLSIAAPHRALSLFQQRFIIDSPSRSRASRSRSMEQPSISAPSTESRAATLPAAFALRTSSAVRQRTARPSRARLLRSSASFSS